MKYRKHWVIFVIAIMSFSALGVLTIGEEPESETKGVQRCVMYEQFTNWHCSLCVPSEMCYCPIVENYYGYDNVAPLYYKHHTVLPVDPAFEYNPLENFARSVYYGVAFLPYMRIDGRWFPAQANETYFKNLIDERLALPANISIQASGTLFLNNNTGKVTATLEAVENIITSDLIVQFALWEHNIPVLERFGQPAPNGVDPWHWTMWDMMPDAYGTELWTGGTTVGDTVELTHEFIIEPEWNISELGISIWVQSNSTQIIEQSHVMNDWEILTDYDVNVTSGSTPGWRFVSYPINATGDVSAIFDDLMWGDGNTTWNYIQWFDPTDPAKPWKTYVKGRPAFLNDFPDVNNTMGFWIHLTSNAGDQVLTVGIGSEPNVTAVFLRSGWNMVGYPALNDSVYTVAQLMADTGATNVEGFNPAAPYRIETLAGGYVLKRGEAYWVKVDTDFIWTVDW